MKYTKEQIKEALRKSRAKWVVPKRGEKVLRSDEKCGFCEMVGNNFDVTGGGDNDACNECKNIFWGGCSCLESISQYIAFNHLCSVDDDWPKACEIMQSEFDRIEKEFCAPEVITTECWWQEKNGWIAPYRQGGADNLSFRFSDEIKSLVGKRTKITIEVLD